MIRGMGMRIGSCAMTGFTSSTPQRLSNVVMAMFALYQAAGRYAIRCLQRIVNLVPATICLALAFVFSGAVGAVAQDTTAPVGVFELPASHDGITPFTAVIVFDEEPKRIWPLELVGLLIRGSTDPETQTQPVQIYTNTDHAPLITNRRKDDNDKRRYLFDVTPRAPVDIRFRLSGGYTDVAGNVGPTISSPAIPYVAPAGGNNQPEANAGPDQVVDPGDTVTLDGSESSDRDGNETITYSWARTGGTIGVTAPTLTGSTTDSPTFTADTLTSGDDDVVHVFTLTVTDDHDETDTDTMTVTVEAPDTNPVPIASAGVDQEVNSGALVTLDGSASGDDGWIASWAWERTGGTEGLDATVPLNNPNAIKPTFTANTLAVGGGDVIHIFTLIVTDNEGATGIDTVAVIIKAPLFAAPVANAGPDQTFDPGATVTLDGSGSTFDSRRTPLDYAWKRTGGTADPVTLAGANTAMPTFTAVAPALLPSTPFATHIFELTVTDSAGEISTDTVTVWIVIPTARSAPVADAGMDRTVTSRAEVRLDGSGSTVHSSRTIRSYAWRWVKQLSTPNVEAITLTDPNTAMASFTAPVLDVGAKDITHVFELTVTDSAGQINKDTVSITVIFPFANPVANAGQDRKVGSGTVVTLDGSDSTVDLRRPDASKSYAWARTGGTGDNTVTLTSETTARPSFMAETLASNDTDVTHIFTLTVTDSAGVQHTDTVTITVTLGNADPVANAGDDQPAVVSGTTVTLDGSRSSDSDGSISKFAWARTGGTGDAGITLSSDSVAEPTFRAEILQTGAADVTHIFTLTVTDDDQATATDTVTITVTPANAVPIANAGPDRTVDPATMVQLDGSDSLDIDGRIVSWAWARTGGTAGGSATLTDAMTARPTFTSDVLQMDDDDVIHIFTLTVTDDDGGIDTATVTITVSFGDTVPPIGRFEAEDGGPVPHSYGSTAPFKLALVFNEGVTVSGSDVIAVISDETPVKNGVAFENRTPTITVFEQDKTDAGRYVFTVTPRDTGIPSFRIVLRARNYQDSAGNRGVADIVTAPILYVDPTVTNIAPVADAGDDRTVNSGMRNVRLDGTGSSDTEGEIRTYAWARTGGTVGGSVTLSDESAAQPTFTADTLTPGGADVTHEFTLTVTDMSRHAIHEQTRQRNPETGVTTIISDTRNPVPSACRDGRASDEHCTLAYRNSAEDTVTVTVDAPPLADAGDDQTVGSAALVTLDGSGSIDSNTGFEHAWEWTGGSEGATAPTLNDKSRQSPTFTSDTVDPGAADVTHTFMLTVTDSRLQSHTDTVTVTVSNPNTNADPVANAGLDREVLAGTVVTLNGSGSSDSDGDDTITGYSWARTGGTGGVTAPTLAATAQPTFTADTLTPGDADVIHIFTLTVTDNAGATDTDTVTITVIAEDTTGPEGTFESPASHNGVTSFTVELVFNEEVEFSEDDLQAILVGVPAQNRGSNPRFRYNLDTHVPTISGFAQDPNDDLRYTFSVTPRVPLSLRIALRGRHYADLSGNTGTNISITIPFSGPSNKRPVAEAGDDLTVASGTEVTLDGSESMDEDGTVQYYAWVRTGGTGDPLALTGADTDMPTFTPRLSGGADDVTHIFTLWVSDNDLAVSEADTVTVMVTAPTAPNMIPVADAGDDRTVQSGVPATLDGGESSDDDGTIKSWAWTRTGGTGNASLALTGADREQSTFTADTLAPGAEDVTHIFSLVVLDDVNVPSVADTVTITVNAPPLANAGSDQTADSAAQVTLDGSGSRDSNTTNLTYAWERTGGTTGGTVTLTGANTNMPTFTADILAAGAADVIHTFTLTVTDDEGAINTDTVTITVDGPNKPPVPNAGLDQTVASGETVTIDGRGSTDSDGFVKGYEWSASGSDLFNNPELKATDTAGIETFTAPVLSSGEGKRTIRYALIVTDNEGLDSGDADEVTITVVPSSSNVRPVANAGTDQRVASGATVTLEGSGTDNGTIQDYYWVRASTGSAPTLSANNVARPTFKAPILVEGSPDVTYTYALRVKDNEGAVSDADEVTITVEIPRVADAGKDQTVAAGATVTLDGSSSSGTIAEYQWSRVSGTSARADVFPGASGTLTREVSRITPTITFVADNVPSNSVAVTHVFALRVFGANRVSSPKDEITVTVNPNQLPIANAGPDQSVAAGMNVDLDGRGSIDNDGTIASYNWTRTGGDATATLTGANTATPSFTAEMLKRGAADTTHTFTLTVTDNNGETDTDTVTVTVIAPNAPPKAVAYVGTGDSGVNTATVDSDSLVFLNASGSEDTDGNIVSYLWERSGGTEGRSVDLKKAETELANFTTATLPAGTADVIHIFKLTVTDNEGAKNMEEATVTITVESPFREPVANAGVDATVNAEGTIALDGSGSTYDDRTTLTYAWTRADGTTTGLTDPNTATARFTAPALNPGAADVTHVFTLTVTDKNGATNADTVTIMVNAPPLANAGADATVNAEETITLDGRGSSDTGEGELTYVWTRPEGAAGTLVDANTSTPDFTAESLADGAEDVTHVFTLTVTDANGGTGTDTVTITVDAPPHGNVLPIAVAGDDRTVTSGTRFRLDGNMSYDPDHPRGLIRGSISEWEWWESPPDSISRNVRFKLRSPNNSFFDPIAPVVMPGEPDLVFIYYLNVKDLEGASCEKLLTDKRGGKHCDSLTVTVTSGFVDPVAMIADGVRSVASGGTVQLDGSGSTYDDRTTLTYAWTRADGTTTGLTTPTMAMASFTPPTLADGAPDVTHVLTLTVTDSEGGTDAATVTITVTSGFVDPVAMIADGVREVASGGTVQLDGSGSTYDDRTTLSYAWTRADGTTTGLTTPTMAMASFTPPTLADGADDVTHVLTLTVTDSEGGTDAATVTITVTSGFVDPVAMIADGVRSVASGGTVQLDGSGSTYDDRTTLSYAWTRADGTTTGLTTPTMAMASFTPPTLADGAPDVTHVLTLTVTDSEGGTDAATVTITVTSGFVDPVAMIADGVRSVASGGTVQLDGSGSTYDDRTTLSYAWTRADGTTTGLTTPTMAMASFTPPTLADGADDVTHVLTLTVTDSEGGTDAATVTITVTSGFVDPVAMIADGVREVASGGTVQLDGSGSTHDDRTTLTYAWTRADGTTTGLTTPTMAMASFTPPTLADGAPDVTHVLTLTVTDSEGGTDAATVTITVTSGFVDPVAMIADGVREVASGGTVQLDGSGSTYDGRTTLSYAWTRADGTTTGLTTPTMAMASFTPPTLADGAPDVTHILTLTVTDSEGGTDAATVTITVTTGFVDPVAMIADGVRSVASGGTVQLDGSGSIHDDRTTLTYAWTRADGTTTGLTTPTMATASFTPPTLADGAPDVTHVLTLTVTDSEGGTDTATVTITVTSGFVDPVAMIADGVRSVASGGTVQLDGSGSTYDDRTTLSYAWTRADGTTTGLTTPTMATASFTPPTLADGAPDVTHILTLTVTDSEGGTDAATVTITVTSGFVDPVAMIADGVRSVASGGTVQLDGSGSTYDDRTTLTYAWTRADGTTTGLTTPTMAMASFTPPTLADGAPDVTHVLTLTVTDSEGGTDAATVTITVTSGFVDPVAMIADGVRSVASGGTVQLDGSGSTYDDRTTLTYAWTRADGTTTGLTTPTMAMASFTPPTLADGADDVTHVLTLTVTDSAGGTDAATVTITVTSGFVDPVAMIADGVRSVASGGTVQLDGSGSTYDDRTTLTYAWTRADGTTTGLTTPTMAMASFTPPTLADGAPDVTHVLTLTVTDSEGGTDAATVTITVTSGFVDPVAMIADGVRSVASGGTVQLDGSGSTHDDRTTLTYAWTRADGTTTGLTTPTMAMASFTPPTLADGAPDVTHVLTLTVTDSEGGTDAATVTITVTSGFVDPVAMIADGVRSVASGGTVQLDGSGSTYDDRTTLTYAWTRADGTTTGLTTPTMAMASFTPPTLADGAPDVTHVLTLTVTDSAGGTDAATVTITVTTGFVDPVAMIADGVRSVASGGTVQLDGSGSIHDDRTTLSYAWTRADGTTTGLTTPTMAMASFTPPTLADGAPDVTHVLTLTVTDSEGGTDTATVTITVTSGFMDPVAMIADGVRSVASGGTVQLDGSGSTYDDRTTLTYAWTRADGTTTGLTTPTMAMASFTPPTLADGAPDVTHVLTLTVTDSEGGTDAATVTITVTSGFVDPVAMIADGVRSVASGGTVQLDGSGSTYDDRTTLTYAWTRADGTTTGLTTPTMAMASFTPPTLADGAPDVTHVLTLTVTDSEGGTDAATVTITVTSGFVDPVAMIADGVREVASGGTVQLDGSGSTYDDRTTLSYAWTRADGTTTGLTTPTMAMASFTPPTLADGAPDVTHVLTLTVTDSEGGTDAATVTITVTTGFVDPVAMIADGVRSVASGGTVQLDGSGSTHDDRTTLTYAWTRADGTTTGLTTPTMAMASFTPPTLADGAPDVTHVLTLTVTDSEGGTDTATVTITVTSGFVDPVAMIADGVRSVASGGTVQLDGSGSTYDDRTTLTYAWTRADGTTTGLTTPTMAMASFTPPTLADGADDVTHVLTLTVTDSEGGTDAATVTITVTSGFVDPVAMIADGVRSVASGGTVQLDGSGSTYDGRTTLTYAWTRADGTTTGLTTPTMAMASFTPPTLADGATDVTHVLTLTVTDSEGGTDAATVTITVTSGFVDPVAMIADGVRSVASGGTVQLDGSGSTYDDRTTLSYAWTRADGTTTGLTTPTMAMASFTPPTLADGATDVTHVLTLTVTDSEGGTDAATVTITVTSGFVDPVAMIADGVRSVASGGTVQLDGSGSTYDDRTTLSYAWTRADGTTTGLTTPTMAMASFTPPTLADGADDVTHVLTLTVTDSEGGTDAATVTITVTSGFVDPVAMIADGVRSVASGGTVQLDGSGSTYDDRTTLSYAWTRADGTTTGLTTPTMAMASFTPPTLADGAPDVTHVLTLTVTDSEGGTDAATATITVVSDFADPVAMIADGVRSVASGGTVQLDGSGSTYDGRTTLSYAWTRADGTTTGLTTPTMAMASFTPPTLADGAPDVTHVLTLTVTDSEGGTDAATVTITVTSGFVDPLR